MSEQPTSSTPDINETQNPENIDVKDLSINIKDLKDKSYVCSINDTSNSRSYYDLCSYYW